MKRNRYKRKKNKLLLIVIIIIIIGIITLGYTYVNNNKKLKEKLLIDKKISSINSHYNKYVKTNKQTILYDENNNKIGKIGKDVEIILEDIKITEKTKYFKLSEFDNIYIKYADVSKSKEYIKSDRYKKYIPFNQNIKTKDKTDLYDEFNNLIYSFNKSYDLPIIIKDNDRYGVELNNQLLYIKKENNEIYNKHNTDLKNTNGVAVLNYHFFYDETNETSRKGCMEGICTSKSLFKSQLELIKKMNMFTITMNELEMYMDGKLQLPKSVLITIDDGGRTEIGIDLLTEYKMNATIFLVTAWYNPSEYYKTEYIELHSHSHNLHNGGKCPGGQGGEIKCLPKNELISDLKKSRELLNNTTAFCYPFYEYNSYSESILKEVGFTMAFIGEVNTYYGYKLAEVNADKMKIPRFVMFNYTTLTDLTNYFNEIK